MQESAHRLDGFARPFVDPLEGPVYGVRIGEHMMGSFPIRVLVGSAEARDPESRRIGECFTEIGRRGAITRCHRERIDNFDWIVTEKAIGKRDVV